MPCVPFFQLAIAGSSALRGTGSNSQRGAPLRASKASTRPLGESTRWLSATAEPTTTTPLTTAGFDVAATSPGHSTGLLVGMVTVPASPKSSQGVPVFASIAIRR